MDRPHASTLAPRTAANRIDATRDARSLLHGPLATPAQVAAHSAPVPSTSDAMPHERSFPDWRARLTRNLSSRSDGRWDPLTYVQNEST